MSNLVSLKICSNSHLYDEGLDFSVWLFRKVCPSFANEARHFLKMLVSIQKLNGPTKVQATKVLKRNSFFIYLYIMFIIMINDENKIIRNVGWNCIMNVSTINKLAKIPKLCPEISCYNILNLIYMLK